MKKYTKLEKIFLYFILCIGIRTIPILVLHFTKKYNKIISVLYLILGTLFLVRSTTYHKKQLGAFGGKVWWQNLRIFHGLVYLLVFYLLIIKKDKIVKKILKLDLLIGMFFFINQYFLGY